MKVHSSFHADSDFFALYESLKKEGKWREIIKFGIAALETKKLTNEQTSLVNCRMASCYFYLGDHESALKAAKNASQLSQLVEHHDIIARSFLFNFCSFSRTCSEKFFFILPTTSIRKLRNFKPKATDISSYTEV